VSPADYLDVFFVFFKASLITFAGQAALPVLNQELVQIRHLATAADISKSLAVGRLSPGPTGMFVVSLGYLVAGWPGAFLAMLGSALPPLVVLPLAPLIRRSLHRLWVGGFMRGIGLASAGLLLAVSAGIVTADGVSPTPAVFGNLGLAVLGFALAWSGKIHPVLIMAIAGVVGYVLWSFGI
jgi:chromate transporter